DERRAALGDDNEPAQPYHGPGHARRRPAGRRDLHHAHGRPRAAPQALYPDARAGGTEFGYLAWSRSWITAAPSAAITARRSSGSTATPTANTIQVSAFSSCMGVMIVDGRWRRSRKSIAMVSHSAPKQHAGNTILVKRLAGSSAASTNAH